MFPVTNTCASNIKPLTAAGKQKALLLIKEYVESYKGRDVVISENKLSFKASFFSERNNKFSGITRGIFSLSDSGKIIFKFYMYGILLGLGIIIAMVVFLHKIVMGTVMAIIFVFGNWFFAPFKFKRTTSQLAEKINRL